MDSQSDPDRTTAFLRSVLAGAGLDLEFHVRVEERASTEEDQTPAQRAPLRVDFTGPDTSLLLARNGELLHALEHVTAQLLRLEPHENHLLVFDAGGFKQGREEQLRGMVERAVAEVRRSVRPFAFPPMSSRERRLLHLALAESGLQASSSGEPPRRFVVLYPPPGDRARQPEPAAAGGVDSRREQQIRERFRRR